MQSYYPAVAARPCCLDDACLQPPHVAFTVGPIDEVPLGLMFNTLVRGKPEYSCHTLFELGLGFATKKETSHETPSSVL